MIQKCISLASLLRRGEERLNEKAVKSHDEDDDVEPPSGALGVDSRRRDLRAVVTSRLSNVLGLRLALRTCMWRRGENRDSRHGPVMSRFGAPEDCFRALRAILGLMA